MAQNQPTSPSSTNSTTANANALNSPSSARRRSLAAVVADTEKVKNTSTDQFGSTQESNLSIAKEYTGSKAVNEVIRAILNADPTINWYAILFTWLCFSNKALVNSKGPSSTMNAEI